MHPSNEQLSAFLDGELSAAEMQQVRDALAQDPALAERLGQMRAIDARLRDRSEAIANEPIPERLSRMLEEDNVVSVAPWRRAVLAARSQIALAASLALLIGFAFGMLLDGRLTGGADHWTVVAGELDRVASGSEARLEEDMYLLSRFTFRDHDDRACRQYQLRRGPETTENVACRDGDGNWQQVASVQVDTVARSGQYQPASARNLLDSTLDVMMQSGPLDLDEEAALLRGQQ